MRAGVLVVVVWCGALALLVGQAKAMYEEGSSSVKMLTPENWSEVEQSNEMWIVEFMAPWCGHCQQLAPKYEKAAEKLKNFVHLGAVDCDAHPEMAAQFGVQGFPTIKVLPGEKTKNPYTNKITKIPSDYQGPRTAKGIVDFALAQQPHKVTQGTSTNLAPEQLKESTRSLPSLLLFTRKPSTSPLLKAISTHFLNRLNVVEVKESEEGLWQRFGVSESPTILLIPQGEGEEAKRVYEGEKEFESIATWVRDFVKPEERSQPERPLEVGTELLILLDKDSFSSSLTETEDPFLVGFSEEGHIEGFARVAYILEGQARVGIVDCSQDRTLCPSQVPSFRLYPHGEDKETYDTFEGTDEPAFKAMREAVAESIPSSYVVPIHSTTAEGFLAAGARTPSRSSFVLFTEKTSPPGALRALSLKHKDLAAFAMLSNPDPQMKAQFSVNKLPSFVAMFPNPDQNQEQNEQGIELSGAQLDPRLGLTFKTMDTFVRQVTAINLEKPEKGPKEDDTNRSGFRSAKQPTGPIPELTHETFDTHCSAGLCAVAVLDGSDEAKELREQYLEILTEVRRRKSPSPFSFSWIDGDCQGEFLTSLDIPPVDMPTLALLSPSKNQHGRLVGKFTVEGLSKYLTSVAAGKSPTREISSLPRPLPHDCPSLRAPLEVSDGEDFLAEILAEEKARQEALEEELRLEREAREAEEGEAKKGKKKGKKKKKKAKAEL